jgi:hypothetical protein
VQLDQMPVRAQPAYAVFFEAMAGRVVDDQEHLAAPVATDELSQELEEGLSVEHGANWNVNFARSRETAPNTCAVLRRP